MKDFKIRCSAIGEIMGASKGGLTETQAKDYKVLLSKEKLTDKQLEKKLILRAKLKEPKRLPDGAVTYAQGWVKEQIYGRRKEISSKYLDKGNMVEDESIEFLSANSDYGFLAKNEDYFENDFLTGTPDIITKDEVIDMKNSWDCFTFPLFFDAIPNKDYMYQLQGYMALTGLKKAKLVYTLMNTDKDINYGKEDNYDEIDAKYRIKSFVIERDEEIIEAIKERVQEIQQYINQINK